MLAEANYVFRSEDSITPLDQVSNRSISFGGASYLLIVDYTSRFPVVSKLSSMTGQHVAN